jgi:hypothetical protein
MQCGTSSTRSPLVATGLTSRFREVGLDSPKRKFESLFSVPCGSVVLWLSGQLLPWFNGDVEMNAQKKRAAFGDALFENGAERETFVRN